MFAKQQYSITSTVGLTKRSCKSFSSMAAFLGSESACGLCMSTECATSLTTQLSLFTGSPHTRGVLAAEQGLTSVADGSAHTSVSMQKAHHGTAIHCNTSCIGHWRSSQCRAVLPVLPLQIDKLSRSQKLFERSLSIGMKVAHCRTLSHTVSAVQDLTACSYPCRCIPLLCQVVIRAACSACARRSALAGIVLARNAMYARSMMV